MNDEPMNEGTAPVRRTILPHKASQGALIPSFRSTTPSADCSTTPTNVDLLSVLQTSPPNPDAGQWLPRPPVREPHSFVPVVSLARSGPVRSSPHRQLGMVGVA